MKQYIDKAAVVAEIEKRIDELKGTVLELGNQESHECGVFNDIYLYEDLRTFLNTLEVKEVNNDAVVEKACDWLKTNITYIHPRTGKTKCVVNLNAFIDAMKGE